MKQFVAIASLCGAVTCMQLSKGSVSTGSSVYEIHFSGTSGKNLTADYTLLDPQGMKPTLVKTIRATMPYRISVNPPAGYQLRVMSYNGTEENPESIQIFKDGVECTQIELMHSSSVAIASCQR